jgi:ParB-like chromosome segregation protein Spo0J
LQNPVCITADRHLLSGNRRIAAFRKLGLTTVPVHIISNLRTATDRLKAERDENTCRKNMTPSELVSLGRALEELERPKARERQGERTDLQPSGRAPGKLDTRDAVAAGLGISGSTYERAKRVVEAAEDGEAPPEVRQAARHARTEMDATGAINPAYRRGSRQRCGFS